MAKQNEIKWEILEDGTISIETGDLGGPNHVSADKLLKELAEVLGGPVTVKKRNRVDFALDGALKAHTHDGHTHTHSN